MKFENSQFESGVSESISSLDKLDKSLSTIGNNGQAFDSAVKGVEQLSAKFSTLEVIGVTAIAKITSSIMDLFGSTLKNLTIGQVASGFDKYSTQLKSVRTIMSATGQSIEDVEQALDKLNTYTDETSYSFSDMVSNIAKFTSVGVDLNDAETAMEGIANWAALSGQGVAEASRAMYNISQAMGSGSMKLIDWKSIQNANMATVQFKQAAIDSAVSLGYLQQTAEGTWKTTSKAAKAGAEVTVNSFESTLSSAWLSKDVMMDVFTTFADTSQELGHMAYEAAKEYRTFGDVLDTVKDAVSSNFMNAFKEFFGNAEEAPKLWQKIGDEAVEVLTAPLARLKDAIAEWKEIGGRDKFFTALRNIYTNIKNVITAITNAFSEKFPSDLAAGLVNFTDWLYNLSKQLYLSEDSIDTIGNVFKGVFGIISMVVDLVKAVVNPVLNVFSSIISKVFKISKSGGGVISTLAESFATLVSNISESTQFTDILSGISSAIGGFLSSAADLASSIWTKISPALGSLWEYLRNTWSKIAPFISAVWQEVSSYWSANITPRITSAIDTLSEKAGVVVDFIKNLLDGFTDLLTPAEKTGEALNGVVDGVASLDGKSPGGGTILGIIGGLAGLLGAHKLRRTIRDLNDSVNPFEALRRRLDEVFETLEDAVEAHMQESIANAMLKFAGGLALLAVGLIAIANIPQSDLQTATTTISQLAIIISTSLGIILKAANGLTTQISSGDSITDRISNLIGAYSGSSSKAISRIGTTLLEFAIAIGIVAGAVWLLSKYTTKDDLDRALGAIVQIVFVITGGIFALSKVMKDDLGKNIMQFGIGVMALSAGVYILAQACKVFDTVKPESIAYAGGLIFVMVMALVGLSKNIEDVNLGSLVVTMLGLAASLFIVAKSAVILSSATPDGIFGAAVLIGVMAAAIDILSKTLKEANPSAIYAVGVAMIFMATALLVVSAACLILSKCDEQGIIAGGFLLAAMGGVLYALAGSDPKALLSAGAAFIAMSTGILIVAASLAILTKVASSPNFNTAALALIGIVTVLSLMVAVFSLLPPSEINKVGIAFLALSAGIFILATALSVLTNSNVENLEGALTSLITVMAVAAALLIGMSYFAAPISVLAVAFAGIGSAVLMLGAGLLLFATAILVVTPAVAGLIAVLTSLVVVIIAIVAAIVVGIVVGIAEGLRALGEHKDAIISGVLAIIELIGETITSTIDTISEVLIKIFDLLLPVLLQCVVKLVYEVAKAIPDILANLIGGLADGIGSMFSDDFDFEKWLKAINWDKIKEIFNKISEFLAPALQGIIGWLWSIFGPILEELVPILMPVLELVVSLITTVVSSIATIITTLVPLISQIVSSIVVIVTTLSTVILGIVSGIVSVISAIVNGIVTVVSIVSNAIVTVVSVLAPVILGIVSVISDTITTVVSTIGEIILAIIELIQTTISGTGDFILDLAQTISDTVIGVIEAIGDVISKVLDGIAKIIETIGGIFTGLFGKSKESNTDGLASSILKGISAGMEDESGSAFKELGPAIANALSDAIHSIEPKLNQLGKFITQGIVTGMRSELAEVKKAGNEVGQQALDGAAETTQVNSPSRAMAEIGEYLDQGLALGMRSDAGIVNKAGIKVAAGLLSAMKSYLQIHSPSKRTEREIGDNMVKGVTESFNSKAVEETSKAGKAYIRGVVSDMSNVKFASSISGFRDNGYIELIENLFSNSDQSSSSSPTSTETSTTAAEAAASSRRRRSVSRSTPTADFEEDANAASYSFVQNNYSPKALSRVEIYRQTRNQIDNARGVFGK